MERKLTTGLIGAMLVAVVVMPPGVASAATIGTDSRVTQQTYVRHDGGTDPTIEGCNNLVPTDTVGNLLQKNEPFSVVDPQDPDIVIAGWNDYCSDWMGLGFSIDGGADVDQLARAGLPGRHVDRGDAVPRVHPDEHGERPDRGVRQRTATSSSGSSHTTGSPATRRTVM